MTRVLKLVLGSGQYNEYLMFALNYRPQGKVMFSEASVCSRWGGGVGQTPPSRQTPRY